MASKEETGMAVYTHSETHSGEFESKDAAEMRYMGKKQQLRRNFEFWSILAFSCCTMITWAGQLFTFVTGLENGGPQGLIIALFVTWTAMAAIIATLAELMSMYPTSAGQYQWTFSLAGPKSAVFLSYCTGWFCVLACYPNYDAKPWQALLLCYALLLVSIFINTVLVKWFHQIEWALFFLYIAGFFIVLVTVIVLSPQKATAHEVFDVFYNVGGWSSDGVSWLVGLSGIMFAWLGADGAIHMAEEVRDASRILPWSLMASVVVNGVMSVAILFAVLFCSGNLLASLSTPTGYPIMQLLTTATGSVRGGTGLTVITLLIGNFSAVGCLAAASRELWAFSRDHGVPGSRLLNKVHPRLQLPLNAVLATAIFAALLNLIQLGSDVALNAVISLSVSAFFSSYLLPFILVLYRRIQAVRGVGKAMPWGPWWLGTWTGIAINIYALIWVVIVVIFSFFPPTVNPTIKTMNWSSLVYGVVIVFSLAFWFLDGRKRYKGPVRDAVGDGEIEQAPDWTKDWRRD